MALKVRTERKKVWVTYTRDDESARFLVAPMSMREIQKLLEKHKKFERQKGQVVEVTDNLGFLFDKVDHQIEEWDGPIKPDGTPLECTRENKLVLLDTEREIIDWVLEQAEELSRQFAEDAVAERKNSKSGAK